MDPQWKYLGPKRPQDYPAKPASQAKGNLGIVYQAESRKIANLALSNRPAFAIKRKSRKTEKQPLHTQQENFNPAPIKPLPITPSQSLSHPQPQTPTLNQTLAQYLVHHHIPHAPP